MAEPALDPEADPHRLALDRARLPLAAALIVTGATLCLGYLLGLVQGPLVAVAGGVALMTFGRGLGAARAEAAFLCGAFLVLAAAWSIGAVRWSSLMLDDLRGAQGVLGPTLLVGPRAVAGGSWVAAGAAVLGLVVWSASPPVRGRAVWLRGAESLPAALATTTVFWGPAIAGGRLAGLAVWTGVVAGLVLVATAAAFLFRPRAARRAALGLAGVALVAAAFLMAGGPSR